MPCILLRSNDPRPPQKDVSLSSSFSLPDHESPSSSSSSSSSSFFSSFQAPQRGFSPPKVCQSHRRTAWIRPRPEKAGPPTPATANPSNPSSEYLVIELTRSVNHHTPPYAEIRATNCPQNILHRSQTTSSLTTISQRSKLAHQTFKVFRYLQDLFAARWPSRGIQTKAENQEDHTHRMEDNDHS